MVPFLQHLPTASAGLADVVVLEIHPVIGTPPLCAEWASRIHDTFIGDDPHRADRAWDWRQTIPRVAFLLGATRGPRLFQLCLKGSGLPLGMVALLEAERWIGNPDEPAVYVWYLSGAPAAATAAFGQPRLLTAATLDIAVTVALNGPALGRLWLHAAPAGGDRLLEWYANQGLERVPRDVRLPQPRVGRRRNDGRYFQLSPQSAVAVSMNLDEYR